MNLRITLLAFLCLCATAILRAERVDMLKAGAKANGKALNTKLINSTIDRLNRGGGGTLFFPAGTYLTGSIHLKSNITLELEAGATLLFSDNFDDYLPFVEVRHEGVVMKSFSPLIYAVDAENQTFYFAHDNTAWKLSADDNAQVEVTAVAKLPFYAEKVRKGLVWDDCYLLVTDGGLYTIPLPGVYWLSMLDEAE